MPLPSSHENTIDKTELRELITNYTRPEGPGEDPIIRFARDVDEGIRQAPRIVDCMYLYDRRGSELFDQICDLPEYYLTRTEELILTESGSEIAAETGRCTLVELGAGSSRKTRLLLDQYTYREDEIDYVAVDVSPSALDAGRRNIASHCRHVDFHPLCTSYAESFPLLRHLGRTMVVFLGSTVGNFGREQFDRFFRDVARNLTTGDYLLIGADMHKEPSVLEAAYNDASGVTSQFTLNLFERMNRELGAKLDTGQIEHLAFYNEDEKQIEIYAEFKAAQELFIEPLGTSHAIEKGEWIHTEVSRKFQIERLSADLANVGFHTRQVHSDPDGLFALLLLQKA